MALSLNERLLLGAEEPVAAHAPSFDEPASPAFPLPLPRRSLTWLRHRRRISWRPSNA